MSDALARGRPSQLARAPAPSRAQVLAELAAARRRLEARLQAVGQRLGQGRWRAAVRRHPVLALSGALLVGYALGRLFSRR